MSYQSGGRANLTTESLLPPAGREARRPSTYAPTKGRYPALAGPWSHRGGKPRAPTAMMMVDSVSRRAGSGFDDPYLHHRNLCQRRDDLT